MGNVGVDWVRMRPLPDAPVGVLRALVREQAVAFATVGNLVPGEYDHLDLPTGPGSCELVGHVVVETGPDSRRRVGAVTLNPVLPAEWRLDACRSHLPSELSALLGRWRDHLEEVRQGGHRDYLRAWHRYSSTRRLALDWEALRDVAEEATGRANAWASRPALRLVRDQILTLPIPPIAPAPHWNGRTSPSTADHFPPRLDLARAWNRLVPRSQKVRLVPPGGFEEFLRDALNDPYLAGCLSWMQETADQGSGLLLDW